MRINLTFVIVNDQDEAERFYTEVLGFVKKRDEPLGDGARWLTVVSPEEPDGIELLLNPAELPAAKLHQETLASDEVPYTQFLVDDIASEYKRLKGHGVKFTQEPAHVGSVISAVFDDTCGNLIQLIQHAD